MSMRLVTMPVEVSSILDDGPAIPAGTPIVVPRHGATNLACICRDRDLPEPRVSAMNYYTRHLSNVRDARRILAWRGAGIGDQLIVGGVLAAIAAALPLERPTLMCDPNVKASLWDGAKNLPFDVLPEPVALSVWESFDRHWVVEGYCDGNHEPDQPDAWDGHLGAIGALDLVPPDRRRVCVPESEAWCTRAAAFLAAIGGLDRPTVLWQLAASTPMRSFSPAHALECLRAFAAAFPAACIILAGTQPEFDAYNACCALPGVTTTRGLALQEVFALCNLADLVVCPDSCLGHVAAAYETPCISYWCPFPARARATHYTQHRNLEGAAPCAPCWAHEYGPVNLQRGCPLYETDPAASRYCQGLEGIPSEAIIQAAKEIL